MLSCSYLGLLIYATYSECDPLTTKLARAKDQLLPLLVMRIFGDYPGLPGLFVAGVFSAALRYIFSLPVINHHFQYMLILKCSSIAIFSSLSTALNSMSAVILEDFVKGIISKPLTKRQTRYVMRGTVAVFGAICVCLVFVVEKLGSVLQLSSSVNAVSNGMIKKMHSVYSLDALIILIKCSHRSIACTLHHGCPDALDKWLRCNYWRFDQLSFYGLAMFPCTNGHCHR